MLEVWRPVQLTRRQMQERRRAAAAHFPRIAAGRLGQRALARQLGVPPSSLHRWYGAWKRGGRRALRARHGAGRTARLDAAQWRTLKGLIRRGALAAGFPTEAWTLRRVAHLIRCELGVTYHFRYLGRALRAHQITWQVPRVQARERDEALLRAFLLRDWEGLKKRLTASGAPLPAWMRSVTRFGPP